MDSIYKKVVELEENEKIFVLCTIIHSQGSTPRHIGTKMIVFPDGSVFGSIGGGESENRVIKTAIQSIDEGVPKLHRYDLTDPIEGEPGVSGGLVDVFIEPIISKSTLLIIGAGHVGKAVSHLAKWVGFKVIIADDRENLCTIENIPEADEFFVVAAEEVTKEIKISSNTFVVLTTRSLDLDVAILPSLTLSPTPYIGVIGSKRRWDQAKAALATAGVSQEKINWIKSPIGLDIKAETPEEIAVSIIGEIILTQKSLLIS